MISPQLPSSSLHRVLSERFTGRESFYNGRWLHLIFRIARMSYRAAVYQSFLRMGKESRVFFLGCNSFYGTIALGGAISSLIGSKQIFRTVFEKKKKIKNEKKISR